MLDHTDRTAPTRNLDLWAVQIVLDQEYVSQSDVSGFGECIFNPGSTC